VSINTFASLELIDYVEDSLAMVDYWRREVGEAADPYLTQLVTTELAMIGPMLPDSARRRLRGLGDGTLERPDSLVPELAAALVASIDGSRLGSVVYAGPSSVTDETRGLVEELLRTHDRADDRPLPAEDKQRELELLVPQRGYLDEEGRPTRVRARQLHERSIDERLWRAAIVPTSVPLVTLDSISGQLGPEDAAIIFHVSPNALSYAVVHQGTPWIMQQPSIPGALRVRATDSWVTISGLEMEILQTRSLIQEDPGPFDVSSDGRAQLQRIGDGFFAEIERYLVELEEHGVEHLCIVAGNPLLMLPFHLAIVARRPLVDRFRISYASNWRLVGRASRATRPVRVTAFGVSGGGELPGLPDAPEEARRIASACGGRAITDERVTVEAIRAALTSSRYVHIAAHGGQIPYASALHWVQTGEQDGSGRLRAADILDLDLRGLELVTLSTCESATLVFDEFGDPRGIAATLFARGAQAVVGTLWPIESTASQDFFERLYAGVGTGRAPFDAFSEAQRATRGDHPQSRDWGAFFYSGRW
jgi:hypothetical protein